MNTIAIVIACGREEEVSTETEAGFLTLGDTPVIAHSLKTLEKTPSIEGIIIAVSKNRVDAAIHVIKRFGIQKVIGVVVGGVNRHSTLKTVLAKLPDQPSIIVIHEASRPFTTREVFEETVKAGRRYGCAIAAHKLPDAVKLAPKGLKATGTLERNTTWSAQTPQVFKTEVLEKIVGIKSAKIVDDESEFVKKPTEVHMVEAGGVNMKIRTSDDLAIATALINAKIA